MPDDEKPHDAKPIFTTFPPGTTAEEAARLLREMVEKHADDVARPTGPDDDGRTTK